jgi:hypothetical protein
MQGLEPMKRRRRIVDWQSLVLVAALTALVSGGAAVAADTGSRSGPGAGAVAGLVDGQIEQGLADARIAPAPIADDAEFLRRVALDLTGVIPSADRASAFLDSKDPEKRAKLVDELLASPLYGRHMADIWEDLLFVRESTNKKLRSEQLADWLAGRFNDNTSWDKIVYDLVTACGTQEENGAATFFIALRTPDKMNDQVCRLLLGVQLQCAQCHDHPFNSWKRSDYWSMAAFFSKVQAGGKKIGKGPAENVNEAGKGRKTPDVETALDLPPKFLGGAAPALDKGAPLRPVLAKWMTAPDNLYFARAMVNRVWAQLFGEGLVNPIDNISEIADASHPELFEGLTDTFTASRFDLKALYRGLCNSRAYQRSSGPARDPARPAADYAQMAIKPMTPQQLYDSLQNLTGVQAEARAGRRRPMGKKGLGSRPRDAFVDFFRPSDGADPSEYSTGIPQVLRLMNAPQMNRVGTFVSDLVKSRHTPAENVEQIYLATFARRPAPAETERLVAYLHKDNPDVREAYTDLLWVLLNSSEFALNHCSDRKRIEHEG